LGQPYFRWNGRYATHGWRNNLGCFFLGPTAFIYTRSLASAEALSLFLIENSALCARIAEALKPGLDIHKALATPID
jgi:hypothetical protein